MNCRPWNSEIGRSNCFRSLHVLEREVERALGDTERLRAHERTRAVERAHRVREAGTFLTDEVRGGHDAVVEDDLTGRRAAHAHLVLELAHREAREARLDDEAR